MKPAKPAIDTALLDRVLLYALPLPILILAGDLLGGIVVGPHWMWNEARLARSFALAYGYSLYPGEHALEPIIGTMHAPVSHILYASLSFLKDPTTAMLAGCCLSAVLWLAPLLWLHMRVAGKAGRLAGAYGFLACAAIFLSSPGSAIVAVMIHTDAAALGFALLATGVLGAPRVPVGSRALAFSAAMSMLSVACKQTMIPVPIALACYLLIAEGPRRFARYALMQLLSGAIIGVAVLIVFHPIQALIFNTWTLGTHIHTVRIAGRILEGLSWERVAMASVIPALAFVVGYALFFRSGSLRASLRSNPWLAFLLVAVFQIPIALRAFTTPWGDYNHLNVVVLFLTITATAGLISLGPAIHPLIPRALLVAIVVAAMPFPLTLMESLSALHDIPAETAFRYEKRHPGRVYFPLNPLAVLLADGRPTHFDYSLADRERAGFPITPAQFAAGLPQHYKLVAYPPGYGSPKSSALLHLVQSMQLTTEPGLEGWSVYAERGAK